MTTKHAFQRLHTPALVLVVVAGGGSLIAAVTVYTSRELGVPASMAAGLIMAGWIVVEMGDHQRPEAVLD